LIQQGRRKFEIGVSYGLAVARPRQYHAAPVTFQKRPPDNFQNDAPPDLASDNVLYQRGQQEEEGRGHSQPFPPESAMRYAAELRRQSPARQTTMVCVRLWPRDVVACV